MVMGSNLRIYQIKLVWFCFTRVKGKGRIRKGFKYVLWHFPPQAKVTMWLEFSILVGGTWGSKPIVVIYTCGFFFIFYFILISFFSFLNKHLCIILLD